MNNQKRIELSKKILQVFESLQGNQEPWVNLACVGKKLHFLGVQYKQYGFEKLRTFLEEFQELLEFKDIVPAEGKPSVCYVRLNTSAVQGLTVPNERKEVVKKKDGKRTKPYYQEGRPPLFALGYVQDISTIIDAVAWQSGISITPNELGQNIKISYDEGDILYLEYGTDGNPIKCDEYSAATTASFAINTRIRDPYDNNLFMCYWKGNRGWACSRVYTENQWDIASRKYKIGRLTFKDYASANTFVKNLHARLLPGESWKYATPAPVLPGMRKKTEYEILESYLNRVSTLLFQEYDKPRSLNYGKVKFSRDNKYALFNSGLLTKFATDVILIGEVFPKKRIANSLITLSNPAVLYGGIKELDEKGFETSDKEVDMVSFFQDISEVVFDATATIDTSSNGRLEHCIEDGLKRNRFPKKYQEQYYKGGLVGLTQDFISAIDRAKKIARRNYKYVVPQCRIELEKTIQFLMPIYMDSKGYDSSPDVALVLSETKIGDERVYIPETVLPLAWAYQNARVICTPDGMWLNPERIEDVGDEPESDV